MPLKESIISMRIKQSTFTLSILVIVLVGLGVVTRFFPHPANFTAIGAVALFAGALFPNKFGLFIPLIAMMVSDVFIGFHTIILFTWGSMAIAGLIGWQMRKSLSPISVLSGSLFSSIQFFLITNWAVWMFTPLYTKNISGLFHSYVMGLPFFRNMMLGDMLYVTILFGAYALAVQYVFKKPVREQEI